MCSLNRIIHTYTCKHTHTHTHTHMSIPHRLYKRDRASQRLTLAWIDTHSHTHTHTYIYTRIRTYTHRSIPHRLHRRDRASHRLGLEWLRSARLPNQHAYIWPTRTSHRQHTAQHPNSRHVRRRNSRKGAVHICCGGKLPFWRHRHRGVGVLMGGKLPGATVLRFRG